MDAGFQHFVFLFTNTHPPTLSVYPVFLRLGISGSELRGFGEDHRARKLSAVEIIVAAFLLRTCSCCKKNLLQNTELSIRLPIQSHLSMVKG